MTRVLSTETTTATIEAIELSLRILRRDGIAPLRGEAFTDTEVEAIESALAVLKSPCAVCAARAALSRAKGGGK